MHAAQRRQISTCLLFSRQSSELAKVKFFGDADDVFNARAQANSDKVGVAGMNDGAPQIVLARRRQIRDVPPADINVTRIVNGSVRVQTVFERGEADDGFE